MIKSKNMFKSLALSSIIAAVAIGCGGSGSSSSSVESTSVSGVVSGSLYEGATVCLDANSDGICQSTETNTISASNGTFTLSGDSTYDVVSFVGAGAFKHEDNGTTTTIINPITFIAPRAGTTTDGSLIISAISTKVWSAMKENNETLSQAKESVAASFGGIDAADLLEDFNGDNLSSIKKAILQAKADSETKNIEASMDGNTLQLATLKTKMSEDVVSRSVVALQATNPVSGLTMPSQVDALDANTSN